ncbi:MAG: hypothetical protein GXY24_05255 [Bacteroidales bacterium]|jgi:hypothetical protein|nr:hypothetical protein [Bacteroidales bacterium]
MKTRYILSALAAFSLLAVGCVEELPGDLAEIQLDKSYVSIPEAGGDGQIKVTSSEAWQVYTDENNEIPSWLTVSPMNGSAGDATVTFHADGSPSYRETTVKIKVGDKFQHITVAQGVNFVSEATCSEVLAGPDGKTYIAEGVCVSIANTQYGNWYLEDETGQIYIYGTVDAEGAYNWASFGIEEGDVVKVQGPKTTYNGTVELVDVKVLKVTKSLVQLVSGSEASLESDGGTFQVGLVSKGGNIAIEIPEAAKAWLSISGIDVVPGIPDPAFPTIAVPDTTFVTLLAAENVAGPRIATISYSSSAAGNTSTVTSTVNQAGLSGTLAVPFSVTEAIEYANKLGGESAKDFYVKGIVSRIANKGEFGSYGNATFFISDDGEFHGEDDKNVDQAKDFEAYRVYYFDNQKWNGEENQGQVAVGDEVIICGKLTLYKGIAETVQNKAYIYSINGVTEETNGLGNLAMPFNSAGAKASIDAKCAAQVYVQGKISKIANKGEFGSYGNATFYISDDGTSHEDDFEAYRVLYLGNRKWVEGDTQIAVGDDVILHGLLTKYGSTYETSSGKAYIYSLNGKTE